jgi:membrane protein
MGRTGKAMRLMRAGVGRARTFGLAAEMSFWVFLSLVPLAAVAGWLAARFVSSKPQITASILASVPEEVRQLVDRQVHRVASVHATSVAPLAVVTFVWLAASGVHAVFEALEVQSGMARPWWKKRLLATATCIALAVGTALVALLGAGLGWLGGVLGHTVPPGLAAFGKNTVAIAIRYTLAVLLALGMTAGLYRVGVPRESRPASRWPILPGAILSVALQALLGWGYGAYVAKVGSGSAYQAGLAVVGVTLMTLWLFSIALLLGVNLNGAIAAVRRPGA